MLIITTILELVALAVLGRYLWRKHLERLDRPLDSTPEVDWKGTGFDPAPLRSRLEVVRKDYAAAATNPPDEAVRKPRLVCLARKMICGLGYFRERLSAEPEQAQTTE